jgi:putative intracellular protease/amidase
MKKDIKAHKIRVAILAEEPMGWGSGKHFFPVILDGYSWIKEGNSYIFSTKYIFDKDILKGKLNTSDFDVLLIPGGGVGDGQSIMKGLTFLPKVRKWKKNISMFIKNGGGCVGICGGTALVTGLKTGRKKPRTILEKLYDKSSLSISCVSSYYKTLAFPLFYPFQRSRPEDIGATAYVFSFSPGETVDGENIHTGGVPIDFKIDKDNPIFSDFKYDFDKIRWWGGPALILPENPDRDVRVLARYPSKDLSENDNTKIYAWRYTGGLYGLLISFFKSFRFIKKHKLSLKNVFLYTYYLAGNWQLTDRTIDLDFSNKPGITAEVFPNENKGRIVLCTPHPEYMVWWGGRIDENNSDFNFLGNGLYKWKDINKLSRNLRDELTHTWWMIRRFTAWAGKVPDNFLPPIKKNEITEKEKRLISKNVLFSGGLIDKINNI